MRIRPFIPAAAAALSAVLLCCTPVQAAQAAEPVFVPYDSYTYSTRSGTAEAMLCPTPYRPGTVIDRSTLGVPLTSPEHMVFDAAGRLYVTDSTANVYQDVAGRLAIKPIRDAAGNWTSGRIETQRTDFAASISFCDRCALGFSWNTSSPRPISEP